MLTNQMKTQMSHFSNLVTLHNALVCSSKYKIDRFVYISSSMVYGNFKSKSVNEDSICKPIECTEIIKFLERI